mgnify:CR=1 FL=1
MKIKAILFLARAIVPYALLAILIPTCAFLLLVGFGKPEAKAYWKVMYGK